MFVHVPVHGCECVLQRAHARLATPKLLRGCWQHCPPVKSLMHADRPFMTLPCLGRSLAVPCKPHHPLRDTRCLPSRLLQRIHAPTYHWQQYKAFLPMHFSHMEASPQGS